MAARAAVLGALALPARAIRMPAESLEAAGLPDTGLPPYKPDGCDLGDRFPLKCKSFYEVELGGKCVMAHEVTQYRMGNNVHRTIENYERMMRDYYKGTTILEDAVQISDKGRQVLAAKMARAIQHDKKFVVGSIGNSVTAGHDNCHLDAYSEQLGQLLRPLFEQAGIDFQSRNGGITGGCGDHFGDQAYCVENILGSDADVTTFLWDYFGNSESSQEAFVRASLSMPRQPMPMVMSLGSDFAHADLMSDYGEFGYHTLAAARGLNRAGLLPTELSRGEKWGRIGDGMHSTTRTGELFPKSHCRRKSAGVLFRNWHGGPMMYQVISDSMAWLYVQGLKDGLKLVHQGRVSEEGTAVRLPAGRLSSIGRVRCASYNVQTFSNQSHMRLQADQSSKDVVSTHDGYDRHDWLNGCELEEQQCRHPDGCGRLFGSTLSFDMQASVTGPLQNGTVVLCIGGNLPPTATEEQVKANDAAHIDNVLTKSNDEDANKRHQQRQRKAARVEKPREDMLRTDMTVATESFQGTLLLDQMEEGEEKPNRGRAVFPECGMEGETRTVSSVKVDGVELLSKRRAWATGPGEKPLAKCAAFDLPSKNARHLTVKTACPLTHVFAL